MSDQNKENPFIELVNGLLEKMPPDFEEWVKKNIIFVYPKGNKNLAHKISKHEAEPFEAIICLFDQLLTKEKGCQERVVLHELAHVKLGHKTPIGENMNQKQEVEAQDLAYCWWTEAQNRERMRKLDNEIGQKS